MKSIAQLVRKAAREFIEATVADRTDLEKLAKMIDRGDYKFAFQFADSLDTVVREEIPGKVWEFLEKYK